MTGIKKIPSVNWWAVIVELERNGYAHAQIGAAIGMTRGAVEGWKNKHAAPKHDDGERLVALWRAVTGKHRDDLPLRLKHTLSAAAVR